MTIRQLLRASKMDDDSDAFMVDGHLFKQVEHSRVDVAPMIYEYQ